MTHFTIFTSPNCLWCDRAKRRIELNGDTYMAHDVSKELGARFLLLNVIGSKTVPQIYCSDKLIGGYDQLVEFYDSFHSE